MLRTCTSLLLAFGSAVVTPALAQSPYAGLEERTVKALSAEQLADLRAGRGMGLALAAELNGYPGPLHVLELADDLALTPTQRTRVAELFAAMKGETVPLGERLIAAETELDRLFRNKRVTAESLAAATAVVGTTQAALRNAHLQYHLTTAEVLTPEQTRAYGVLRGYAAAEGQKAPRHGDRGGHSGHGRRH